MRSRGSFYSRSHYRLKYNILRLPSLRETWPKLASTHTIPIPKRKNQHDEVLRITRLVLANIIPTKNDFKMVKSVANIIAKILSIPVMETVKENELCTRYLDPLLCGLFDGPDAGVFFRW